MADKLALFVHGLGGKPSATWGSFGHLISQDPDLRGVAVGHFGYPTSLFRLPFTRKCPRVQTLAGALRTQIDYSFNTHSDITLVCHSLGGLIGKQYLIEQIDQKRPLRVRRVVFYAVPHNGSSLASVGAQISWRHGQLQQLCRDSDLVRHISEGWHRCEAWNHVQVCYVVAALDRVVDEHSARETWTNSAVEVISDCDHITIVKPMSADDLAFRILKNLIHGSPDVRNGSKRRDPGEPDAAVGRQPAAADLSLAANADVRISMCAILRVEQRGQYLLVRNLHRPESYCPFGGVYKYSRDGRRRLDEIDFRPQAIDTDMRDDLRGFLPGRHLPRFVSWFKEGQGRENASECLRRELSEECAETGFDPGPELPKLQFSFVRTVIEGPEPLPGEPHLQYRIFDVYELVTDTEEGRSFLQRLETHAASSDRLIWASSQEAIKGRFRGGQIIGAHTPYLFGSTRHRSPDPSFAS